MKKKAIYKDIFSDEFNIERNSNARRLIDTTTKNPRYPTKTVEFGS